LTIGPRIRSTPKSPGVLNVRGPTRQHGDHPEGVSVVDDTDTGKRVQQTVDGLRGNSGERKITAQKTFTAFESKCFELF
jgi:hypothetical protein